MPTYQQLQDEVSGWLNRKDIYSLIPGWTQMIETEIAETLRARCMVCQATLTLTGPYFDLPDTFTTMESIRDYNTGEPLELKDEWSGHWYSAYADSSDAALTPQIQPSPNAIAYRLVANSIEFLPHPTPPNPPNPNWVPQQVLMGWYAKPAPLVNPSDSNSVLEAHYAIYLFGLCKYGAMFELDDARAQQMDNAWNQAVTRANLWKQQSDYSGAPYRAELATVF